MQEKCKKKSQINRKICRILSGRKEERDTGYNPEERTYKEKKSVELKLREQDEEGKKDAYCPEDGTKGNDEGISRQQGKVVGEARKVGKNKADPLSHADSV